MLKIYLLLAISVTNIAAINFDKDGNLYPLELDRTTGNFRDSTGLAYILHGVNAVVKAPPYIPDFRGPFHPHMSLNEKDMEDMYRWGFNVVRLGIIWEAVETAPNVYNNTYLNEIEELINRLGEKGIYTVIDSH